MKRIRRKPPIAGAWVFPLCISIVPVGLIFLWAFLWLGFGKSDVLPVIVVQSGVSVMFSIFGFLIGLARILFSNSKSYWEWLKQTPWESEDAPPFESPLLHLRDAGKTALFVLVATVFGGHGAEAFAILAGGYLIGALCIMGAGQLTRILAIISFPAMACLVGDPSWLAVDVAFVFSLILSQKGIKDAMLEFHLVKKPDIVAGVVGAPMSLLPPVPTWEEKRSLVNAALVAFVPAAFIRVSILRDDNPHPWIFAMGIVVLFVFWRIGIFWANHRPPISFIGRLRSRRFIIPGYDRILLPSIYGIVSSLGMAAFCATACIPSDYSAALIVYTGTFLVTGLKPSLREWNLTGHYRAVEVRDSIKRKKFVRL